MGLFDLISERLAFRLKLLGCTDKMNATACLERLCSMNNCEYAIEILGRLAGDGTVPARLLIVPVTDIPVKCYVINRDKYSIVVFIGRNDVYCYRIDVIDGVEVVSVCGEKDMRYARELIHRSTSDMKMETADTIIG